MKCRWIFFLLLVVLVSSHHSVSAQEGSTNEGANRDLRLPDILKRFPESDENKDGELTQEEARAFFQKRREGRPGERPQNPKGQRQPHPKPTADDVAYGDHEKQAFDIWSVPGADAPTPLVIFIHGGGFRSGDKSAFPASVIESYHEAGIAFAAMNYRLSDVGPYPIMMEDAARGLQTIRHRAEEWNIDPDRIACYGGSAGAGISLWLGFHEDRAEPESEDPIARHSTRIVAAGTMNGQSTYDMRTFRNWFGVPDLEPGPALPLFYAVQSPEEWESERVKKLMTEASSITHLTEDDVPVYMTYSRPNTEVTKDTSSAVWVHHVKLGLRLEEAMSELGLECLVIGPDVKPENDPYGSLEAFLIAKLNGE